MNGMGATLQCSRALVIGEGSGIRHGSARFLARRCHQTIDRESDDGWLHIAAVVLGVGSHSPVLLSGDEQFGAEVDTNLQPVRVLRSARLAGHARAAYPPS